MHGAVAEMAWSLEGEGEDGSRFDRVRRDGHEPGARAERHRHGAGRGSGGHRAGAGAGVGGGAGLPSLHGLYHHARRD